MPFAIRHPNSQLVGIDLSEYQINIGQQMMEQVGVKNVAELVAADISQVSFNIKFDYIICHGVFSWVPEAVRHAILKNHPRVFISTVLLILVIIPTQAGKFEMSLKS